MTSIAPYHEKSEWLEARKSGVGGSEIAAIANLHPYKTALEVWRDKMGQGEEVKVTWPMRRGLLLEPIAAKLYSEETGREVRRQPLRRHSEHKWMIANVDRQIFGGTGNGEYYRDSTGALEVKAPGLHVLSKIKREGLPSYMVTQIVWYLGVLGYDYGSFCLFNPEAGPPIHFDIERDDDLIEQLIERGRDFWENHVLTGKPPKTDADQSPIDVPEVEGELTIVDDEEWREAARDLVEARKWKNTAKELESAAKEDFQAKMKRAEVHAVEVPGIIRAYFKPYPGRTSWKKTAQAIANDLNVNLENYIAKGSSYERFTPYPLNGE